MTDEAFRYPRWVEVRLLGSLEILEGGKPVSCHGPKERTILAILAIHAGQAVSDATLIEALWGDSPPPTAVKTLRVYVSRIRKALGEAAAALVTEPGGYRLDRARVQRDVDEVENLLDRARSARTRGGDLDAVQGLIKAESYWRGRSLGDLADEWFATGEAARLDELRRLLAEERVEAEIALGHHAAVIPELDALCADHPLRERLFGLRMLALYRSGRQAEALRTYQELRRRLVDELGLEPSAEIRELESAIVRQDTSLGPTLSPPPPAVARPVPRGVISFLLTDVEGSTDAWRADARGMAAKLRECSDLISRLVDAHDGVLLKARGEGDSTFSVFETPSGALRAAVAIQRHLTSASDEESAPMRLRIGVHTGEAAFEDNDYFGVEVARAARIRDAGHGGQILVSAATADLVAAQSLPEEAELVLLGSYRLRGFDHAQPVLQLVGPGLSRDFPPLRTPKATSALPISPTELVGRAEELAQVRDRLTQARLVSLVGSGGCGKTRLALEAARLLEGDFIDGAVFVDLAPLTDATHVDATVATALGLRETARQPLREQLTEHLADKDVLIILDNGEHLLAACQVLATELLAAARGLRILATSREALGAPGESVVRVLPLAIPPADRADTDELADWPSVRLFVERARAADPGFALSEHNAAWVVDICRHLDGIPLALELAAVRVRSLGVPELARTLGRQLRVLGSATGPTEKRHQTLEALMDWSYELLSEGEARLFQRLSVFNGGFDLEAVEAVCGEPGDDPAFVVEELVRLVDRSLVLPEHLDPVPRYRLLETIRQYADDRLPEEEGIEVRGRHLLWCRQLAERGYEQLMGADPRPAIERLEREHDNIRQALEWALGGGNVEGGVRMATFLGRFWAMRGHVSEGRAWLGRAMTHADAVSPWVAGRAFYAAASFSHGVVGDVRDAEALVDQALTLERSSGDREGESKTLCLAAQLRQVAGDHEQARVLFEQALAVATDLDDDQLVGSALAGLGDVASGTGALEEARRLYDEALTAFRTSGEQHGIAQALLNLAGADGRLQQFGQAAALYDEARAIFESLDDRSCMAGTLESLADAVSAIDEVDRARGLLLDALRLRQDLGQTGRCATAMEALARLAAREGDAGAATLLLARAEALRQDFGVTRPSGEEGRYDQLLEEVRGRLGQARFAEVWEKSSGLEIDEAVAAALAPTEGAG